MVKNESLNPSSNYNNNNNKNKNPCKFNRNRNLPNLKFFIYK